jgi:hypothetical protein
MVLLFVPIALLSPRFSKLWLVPACTPLIITLSDAIFPVAHTRGVDPLIVREAALWLVLQAIVLVRLVRAGGSAPQRTELVRASQQLAPA